MTSWRYVINLLFLFVCLSRIHLSEEGCVEQLQVDNFSILLPQTISLVQTKDLKDTMECTLEKKCKETGQGSIFCNLLNDCFKIEKRVRAENMCKDAVSTNVPYYHLMCLVAKAVGLDSAALEHTGCEYETTCKFYSEAPYYVIGQTTVGPSTTVTTKAPKPLPTTTVTETTTATSTEMSPTTTAPTTLSQPNATDTHSHADSSEVKALPGSSQLIMVLVISGILNVVLPVAVYWYMRHKWKQDRRRWEAPECHCSFMHSANVSNGGTVGNGALD